MKTENHSNLKWQSFQTHTKKLLSEIFYSSSFSDVTLICDDQIKFKVHKFVLSSCSSVFKNILVDNADSPCIYMRGVAKQEMESVLQFIYLGEVTMNQSRITEFINLGKDLNINEISEAKFKEEGNKIERVFSVDYNPTLNDSDISSEILDDDKVESLNSLWKKSAIQMKEKDEAKFHCPDCPMKFSSRKGLLYHIRSEHDGIRYQCEHCEYEAKQHGQLRVHIKYKHEGIRFPCKYCNTLFTTLSSLRRHVKNIHKENYVD